jgi:hypothetical protein
MRERTQHVRRPGSRALSAPALLAIAVAACACVQTVEPQGGDPGTTPVQASGSHAAPAPARAAAGGGDDDAGARAQAAGGLGVLTWNLDWFQDPSEGPSDDAAGSARKR